MKNRTLKHRFDFRSKWLLKLIYFQIIGILLNTLGVYHINEIIITFLLQSNYLIFRNFIIYFDKFHQVLWYYTLCAFFIKDLQWYECVQSFISLCQSMNDVCLFSDSGLFLSLYRRLLTIHLLDFRIK